MPLPDGIGIRTIPASNWCGVVDYAASFKGRARSIRYTTRCRACAERPLRSASALWVKPTGSMNSSVRILETVAGLRFVACIVCFALIDRCPALGFFSSGSKRTDVHDGFGQPLEGGNKGKEHRQTLFLLADQLVIFQSIVEYLCQAKPMRLTSAERAEIVTLAKHRFGQRAVVRLFGSRIDENALGGDIDLHIQAEKSDLATLANELEFVVELKDRIGDEKIDVIVRGPGHIPRGIDEVAIRTGIIL